MKYIFINDDLFNESEGMICAAHRGFLFGDGVFETCKIIDGEIINWEAHLTRFEVSLKFVKINFLTFGLKKQSELLLQKNYLTNGFLRLYVSRGIGSEGYLPKKNIKPLLVISTSDLVSKITGEVILDLSKFRKNSTNYEFENHKVSQGLQNSLVKMQAIEDGFFDSILLNDKNEICESSSANIFWFKDNQLFTPDYKCGLLLGTIRQKIIENSRVEIVRVGIKALQEADEIFLTNVRIGILSVQKLSFSNKTYGSTKTIMLQKKLDQWLKSK